jgi:thiamine-phosphate pyrophosphorylase
MAGSAVASVAEVAATGADFVALHAACWSHPNGPDAAVREALDLVSSAGER